MISKRIGATQAPASGWPLNPLVPKTTILVNTDFPLAADVQIGWLYYVRAAVTDNAGAPYTNTGQTFADGDEIFWNGTDWTNLGPSGLPPIGPAGGGLNGFYPNPGVNQGPGSGLDADTLDGVQGANYAQVAGQIGGSGASPDIRGIRETGSPTLLVIGAIADGEFLYRSGANVVGGVPAGGDAYRSWHSTIDIAPSETVEIQIQPPAASSTVKMWLHGRAWHNGTAGALDLHAHTGNNAHTHTGPSHAHTFNDSPSTSVEPNHTHTGPSHTHSFSDSFTTASESSHTHTGPSHTHSFSDPSSTTSTHSGHTHTQASHNHTTSFLANTAGAYIQMGSGSNFVSGTSDSKTPSINSGGSHSHTVAVSGTTGSGGTGATGAGSSHSHTGSVSGTTGSGGTGATGASGGHSHTVTVSGTTSFDGTGLTGSTGAGLSTEGVATTAFPGTVQIRIDGTDRTGILGGPWGSGLALFDTGELDITPYCTGLSHSIEVVETGGTGGRLQYSIHANG